MSFRTMPNAVVNIWGESALGTRPSPVTKAQAMACISEDLGRVQTLGKSRVIRADPNMAQPPRGRYQVQGRKLTLPFQNKSALILAYKFFSSYGVTGASDPYTHTMKMAAGAFHAATPYFGCEIYDAESGKCDVLDGCVVKGIEFDVNTDDTEAAITYEIWGLGKGDFDNATRQDTTPDAYTEVYWNMRDCTIKIDTVQATTVLGAKAAFSRAVSVRSIPNGLAYATYLILGRVDNCQVTLTALFDSTSTVRSLATGEAEHAIELGFYGPTTPANRQALFTFPEVMCYLTNVPALNADGNEIETSVESLGYYQDGVDATSLKCVSKSDLATYVGLIQ